MVLLEEQHVKVTNDHVDWVFLLFQLFLDHADNVVEGNSKLKCFLASFITQDVFVRGNLLPWA
jgi:hypothetical protein